ncbi:MAG: HD domain-containing protein [Nitrospirae bacterium]|nr:HD domain-containing protein [Nitrospirota bacterium]MBI3376848.1 HD domain-containing protein [Nitrospirota bacterium]
MKKKDDLTRLLFSISSLVDLGQEVTSSDNFSRRMKTALYVITGTFSVPKAALLRYNPQRYKLELLASKGLKDVDGISMQIKTKAVKAIEKNEPHAINTSGKDAFYGQSKDLFKKTQAKTFIPLFAKDEFVGAIILGKRLSREGYLKTEKDVLKIIANQIAITLHNSNLFKSLSSKVNENKRLYENMRHIYHDTIQAFAAAIDAKDVYTKNHSFRVSRYAVAIAMELGWKEKDVEAIYVAGLLHDIGKITIDRGVINKGEDLSVSELSEIKRHPQISYNILSKINFPWKDLVHFVKHHHERVDGRGYPDSLSGEGLSDGVKILALADAFDAMTTDRPYRKKLHLSEALKEVRKCLGTQFDSKISNIFFRVLQKELKGQSKEAQILPHLDKEFDPAIIITLLEGIIAELSA